MKDAIYAEGIPALMANGYTPMVTISSDKPVQWAADSHPFFEEPLKSSLLSQCVINHLAQWELGARKVDERYAKMLSQAHRLPFADLFPWCGKGNFDLPVATKLLRRYLRTVNPIVVTTDSELVTSVAFSGFAHAAGLSSRTEFVQLVGRPVLLSYNEPGQKVKDNDWVVIIPSYHPGFFGHGGTSGEHAGQVFYDSKAVTWFADCEALKLSYDNMSKKEMCEHVLKRVNEVTGPSTEFGKQLVLHKTSFQRSWNQTRMAIMWPEKRDLAKQARAERIQRRENIPQLKHLRDPARRQQPSDASSAYNRSADPNKIVIYHGQQSTRVQSRYRSWHKAREELSVILLSGFAHGEPSSSERLQQALSIYEKSVGPLMALSIAVTEDDFVEWAHSVPMGRSYYLEASQIDDQIAEIPNLLRCHVTGVEDPDNPKWQDDQSTMQRASQDIGSWIHKAAQSASRDDEATTTVSAAWFQHLKEIDPKVFESAIKEQAPAKGKAPVIFDSTQPISGSEVELVAHKERNAQLRYGLQWADASGKTFKIEDFLLPLQNVLPAKGSQKRFI